MGADPSRPLAVLETGSSPRAAQLSKAVLRAMLAEAKGDQLVRRNVAMLAEAAGRAVGGAALGHPSPRCASRRWSDTGCSRPGIGCARATPGRTAAWCSAPRVAAAGAGPGASTAALERLSGDADPAVVEIVAGNPRAPLPFLGRRRVGDLASWQAQDFIYRSLPAGAARYAALARLADAGDDVALDSLLS